MSNNRENNDEYHSDDWEVIKEGSLKGVSVRKDKATGDVLKINTSLCRDTERWKLMPPLDEYQSLSHLDLHKSRYLKVLHPSVGKLTNLQCLSLTRCESLEYLPDSIGELRHLEEVRFTLISFYT
jgi:hypothetical protein